MKNTDKTQEEVFLEDAARGIELDVAVGGKIKKEDKAREVILAIREWNDDEDMKLRAKVNDTLGEVLEAAGKALGTKVLPPGPEAPLDLLRGQLHSGEWSGPIADLSQPLGKALEKRFKKHFAVEYLLVVKINALWGVSPSANPTPRQLLAAFGMDANEYTLYPPNKNTPYPVDTPMRVKRGQHFEAQKDGRYGDGRTPIGKKSRGTQTIEDDVRDYKEAGATARLFTVGDQPYVEVANVKIPSPPWDTQRANILIAIPATYPTGGLDAFYLKLPIGHASGDIPRKQGVLQLDAVEWLLISWHYHPTKPWNAAQDDLSTHVEHCRGFFLERGVRE